MTQETFPEIQAATEALQQRIRATETEITEMKETIAKKKQLVKGWKKAIAVVSPATIGKRAPANQSA